MDAITTITTIVIATATATVTATATFVSPLFRYIQITIASSIS
jgi:hypothetical protein